MGQAKKRGSYDERVAVAKEVEAILQKQIDELDVIEEQSDKYAREGFQRLVTRVMDENDRQYGVLSRVDMTVLVGSGHFRGGESA